MIQVVTVGKKHEDWVVNGIERYQKRLKQPFTVKWELINHSSLNGSEARQRESEAILARIDRSSFVILLDETGTQLSSPSLSRLLEQQFLHSKSATFIIGGAYGVNNAVKDRADYIWSLSDLVFPHQLVRLLLIEQIYRAQEIERGSNYHHY